MPVWGLPTIAGSAHSLPPTHFTTPVSMSGRKSRKRVADSDSAALVAHDGRGSVAAAVAPSDASHRPKKHKHRSHVRTEERSVPDAGDLVTDTRMDTLERGGEAVDAAAAAATAAGRSIPGVDELELREHVERQDRELASRRRYAQNILSKARRKGDIKYWNKLIADFGTTKQLDAALQAYRDIVKAGVQPTVYTFTNLINACVRCGEVEQAQQYLREMAAYGVQPNEVTFTVLMKGLCEDGRVGDAYALLARMAEQGIVPNIRTFNTLLRGCVRTADADRADQVLQDMHRQRIRLDATSHEYYIKCLCQNLRTEEAAEAWLRARRARCATAPACAALATACAVAGDAAAAARYAAEAESMARAGPGGGDGGGGGGGGGGDGDAGAVAVAGAQYGAVASGSVAQFVRLRHYEIEEECERVRAYVQSYRPLPRCVDFRASPRVRFVPDPLAPRPLKLRRLFGNRQPVCLEVCSGHGDWIAERAARDPTVNWVALEMRTDRVQQIYTRLCMQQLPNLVVLAGEALATLSQCVRDRALQQVFVNFPNPPVWTQSRQRLITAAFLRQVHRVLQRRGTLTIVTDEPAYARCIAGELEALRALFAPVRFMTQLPPDYGSSYFDRLWSNGGRRRRRYYMQYARLEPEPAAAAAEVES